jgi:hypothetical protein
MNDNSVASSRSKKSLHFLLMHVLLRSASARARLLFLPFLIEVLPDAQVAQASMSDETYYFPFLAMCIGYAIHVS